MQRDELELNLPPAFEIGEKVRVRKLLKNDGTFPGKEVGASFSEQRRYRLHSQYRTYLQTSYIYAVHFLETGFVVGCKKKELESVEESHESNATHE